jgi:hypothetical protein
VGGGDTGCGDEGINALRVHRIGASEHDRACAGSVHRHEHDRRRISGGERLLRLPQRREDRRFLLREAGLRSGEAP